MLRLAILEVEFLPVPGHIAVVCGRQTKFRHVMLGVSHRVKALVEQRILSEYAFLSCQLHAVLGEVCAARDEFIAVEILGEIQSPVQPVAVLQFQHCLPFLQPVGFPLALFRPDIAEVNGMPHQFSGGVILGEDICELGQGTVHIHRNALLQGLRIQGVQPQVDNLSAHSFLPQKEMEALVEKYQHPILKKYGEMAKEVGGHGGMDFIMMCRLVYCLQNGLPLDMDVYDLAEWCCLAELGELSMDNGCAPVAFPDFTRGEWNKVQGYKHAYASPEAEKEAADKAAAFTAKLKEQGKK